MNRRLRIWHRLVEEGEHQAAISLLCHVFYRMEWQESLATYCRTHRSEDRIVRQLDRDAARLRECAMVMVRDDDGTRLKHWIDLYRACPVDEESLLNDRADIALRIPNDEFRRAAEDLYLEMAEDT